MRTPDWVKERVVLPLLLIVLGLIVVAWAFDGIRHPSLVGKLCGGKDGHKYRWVEAQSNEEETEFSCERVD
jgi:hypothetical protein